MLEPLTVTIIQLTWEVVEVNAVGGIEVTLTFTYEGRSFR